MVFLNIRDRLLSELAGPLWLDQTAPLGWLALQRVMLQTLGTADRTVRALSVLCGIGTLLLALWVALRWMRPGGAAVFILLCSLGQWMVHYALEAKPYATDAFWSLLLPSLAVWATEAGHEAKTISLRRSLVWWIAAIVGQWISYGAIFVAPGCAVLLCGLAWRRQGPRHALLVALQGIPWLASFAAHYYLVIRHARASDFLTRYWSAGMPPEGATFGSTFMWLGQQAEPLALHPGGTTLWLFFWLAIAYGIAVSFRERPVLALSWLLVPVSACLYAFVGLVPLTDRLAFWILPSLYAAIALGADDSLSRANDWLTRRTLADIRHCRSHRCDRMAAVYRHRHPRTRQSVASSSGQPRTQRSGSGAFLDGAARARGCSDFDTPWTASRVVVWQDQHRRPECGQTIFAGAHFNSRADPCLARLSDLQNDRRTNSSAARARWSAPRHGPLGIRFSHPRWVSRVDPGHFQRVFTTRQLQGHFKRGGRRNIRFEVTTGTVDDSRHSNALASSRRRLQT